MAYKNDQLDLGSSQTLGTLVWRIPPPSLAPSRTQRCLRERKTSQAGKEPHPAWNELREVPICDLKATLNFSKGLEANSVPWRSWVGFWGSQEHQGRIPTIPASLRRLLNSKREEPRSLSLKSCSDVTDVTRGKKVPVNLGVSYLGLGSEEGVADVAHPPAGVPLVTGTVDVDVGVILKQDTEHPGYRE